MSKKTEQEPAVFLKEWSDWRDMVVVNIMRHGSIDKHLARELANHFQSMTPQPKEPEQEPVAFPRQAGDSTWTIDTAFIWRVKHTIDPDTPHDFIPSEEQIETVLLALEKIPSGIYTTPPQRTWVGLDPEEQSEMWDRAEKRQAYQGVPALAALIQEVETKLKEKNNV